MNINEEKAFVYSMMKEVTEERRRLTDIYYDLKKRLDDLDRLEHRGVDELSLQGMIDLHNAKTTALAVANIQRESMRAIERVQEKVTPESIMANLANLQEQLVKVTQQSEQTQLSQQKQQVQPMQNVSKDLPQPKNYFNPLANLTTVPRITPKIEPQKEVKQEVLIEKIQREQERAIEKVKNDVKPIDDAIIPKAEIIKEKERAIDKDKAKRKGKKTSTVNFEKVSSIIMSILKEAGQPVSSKDLYLETNRRYDFEIDQKNFSNNIMFRMAKDNPKIDRAMRGYYQYKN